MDFVEGTASEAAEKWRVETWLASSCATREFADLPRSSPTHIGENVGDSVIDDLQLESRAPARCSD
jgi:hypothetical protein